MRCVRTWAAGVVVVIFLVLREKCRRACVRYWVTRRVERPRSLYGDVAVRPSVRHSVRTLGFKNRRTNSHKDNLKISEPLPKKEKKQDSPVRKVRASSSLPSLIFFLIFLLFFILQATSFLSFLNYVPSHGFFFTLKWSIHHAMQCT